MNADDERPPVWVGHVTLRTDRLEASAAFMERLGMRPIFTGEDVAVLELRGGTHLVVLRQDEPAEGDAGFDLMVEDLDAAHRELAAAGVEPSEISRGRIHDAFTVRDPGGASITFNSSHVSDRPV